MNYDEILPNGELRARAREQMKGAWGKAASAYLVLFLIYLPYYVFSALDSIDAYMPYTVPSFPFVSFILSVAALAVSGPFTLGFTGLFLYRVRGGDFEIKNMFWGFNRFASGFSVMFFTSVFTTLWTLLLVIPGIVKAFGYSMAYFIVCDDPETGAYDALKKSQIMMKGYKMKLFLLELSFAGWGLLCILTLGIGFLWLNPYMSLSMANFYENLKRNQEKTAAKTPVDLFRAT